MKLLSSCTVVALVAYLTAEVNSSGIDCAVCTIALGVIYRRALIHNSTIDHEVEKLCDLFPAKSSARKICDILVETKGPTIIKLLTEYENPDVVCGALGLCTQNCSLYPPPPGGVKAKVEHVLSANPLLRILQLPRSTNDGPLPKICNIPKLKPICEDIFGFANNHEPLEDKDGDGFSTIGPLRGTYWRGKDCEPSDKGMHPGAMPIDEDKERDSNCNGIWGVNNKTGVAWETELCSVDQYGVAVLGDSASAHFHVPPEYLDASKIGNDTYKDIDYIAANEFDWPMLSAVTAFYNSTKDFPNIRGAVNSTYEIFRSRNLCMHRDYQNIGVNGARSGAMNSTIQQTLARNAGSDHPLFLVYALIGNDVCNGHEDTIAHMTTPAQFKTNVEATLAFLDKKLPKGSHVMMMGLADGRVLYEYLHQREHPIGMGITYKDVYEYLNCLSISPCRGWMNINATLRNATTQRANELSDVLKSLAASTSHSNYKLHYFDNPLQEIINRWMAGGGQVWELIEPVDGFHPNQLAMSLIAGDVWEIVEKEFGDFVPPINPNNAKIKELFGDQGGY